MPKASRKDAQASSERTENRNLGRNGSASLLDAIDKGLEDIRSVITCRVCVRPLYEPFTVECGHTFCYSCLMSWFEKNAANKTCPDCRAKITRKPAAAYLVQTIRTSRRFLVANLTYRSEILPKYSRIGLSFCQPARQPKNIKISSEKKRGS